MGDSSFFCRGATWGARSRNRVRKYLTYIRRAKNYKC